MTFLVASLDGTRDGGAPSLRSVIEHTIAAHGGRCFVASVAARVAAAFTSAADAVACAAEVHRGVAQNGGDGAPGRLRIALHTGDAYVRDDGQYTGAALRQCEALVDIANVGQTLVTSLTASTVNSLVPAGWSLQDLGRHRLRDMSPARRVFELRGRNVGGEPQAPRSLERYPNNLPIQITSFVGRQAELAAVHELVTRERLVTLTGVGGSGKTRLAAQVAAQQVEGWPDGVRWVELGAVADPALVAALVASATGVLVEPVLGPLRSTTLQLADRRLLVCLDNCEHLLDAVAEVADALLRTCPEVSILTTSREPLGVAGEVVWAVPTLVEDEALALFLERGSQVRPWLTLDPSNEIAVRTMCTRLDGIPLALELAAAWLRTLTPQQIEAGLDDRFALLVRAPRGIAARQQTLEASMAWSHDLLDEPDRLVFRRLAVFAGGFDLAAARAVCADPAPGDDVLGAIGRLVDKSLIVVEQRGEHARYRLLETIRQYAADRLDAAGETAMLRGRHLAYYLTFVEQAEPDLDRDRDAWRTRLGVEHDNLRSALEFGLAADDPDRGRRLAAGLPWLWNLHGQGGEGFEFLQRAIRRAPQERSVCQARLLAGVAVVADTAGPLDLEFDVAQRGLEMATEFGDERTRCLCLELAAIGQFYTDFDAAWALNLDAQRVARAASDGFIFDGSRALEGIILNVRDRHDAARPLLEVAIEALLRRGDRGVAATTLAYLACGALSTGEIQLARQIAERGVQLAEPLGDYHRVGTSRSVLAMAEGVAGNFDTGLAVLEPVLRLIDSAANEIFVPWMARVLGTLDLWRGELDQAVRWLEQEARSTDRGVETYLAALALPPLGAALRQLGRRDEAARVLDRGVRLARTLGMPGVLADALEQQAHLVAADDPDRAAELHFEALAQRVEHGLRTFYADSLDALATLAARTERAEHAVRVFAASDRARQRIGYPRRPADRQGVDEAVTTLRRALGDRPFEEQWTAAAKLSLDEVVAYVRRPRGPRDRPLSGWASLTPAEHDVVRLAVQGLENPEIGARLFMSRGTVKTHLLHVYAKLQVANRTELAAQASAYEPAARRPAK